MEAITIKRFCIKCNSFKTFKCSNIHEITSSFKIKIKFSCDGCSQVVYEYYTREQWNGMLERVK